MCVILGHTAGFITGFLCILQMAPSFSLRVRVWFPHCHVDVVGRLLLVMFGHLYFTPCTAAASHHVRVLSHKCLDSATLAICAAHAALYLYLCMVYHY